MASARIPMSKAAVHDFNEAMMRTLGGGLKYGCITQHESERYIDERGRWEVHWKEDPNVEQVEGKKQFVALVGHVNEVKDLEMLVMANEDFEKGRTVFELLKRIWSVMSTKQYLTNLELGMIRATPAERKEVTSQFVEASKHVEKKDMRWWFKDTLNAHAG